ncbi:hypothetical protein [uncultured Agathobaculum sp.]|uniref:hypothetical protein n=1 Tax=uncultured Agathobaculum sp. TaxID=2048140 RepID=UPI00320A61BE
MNRYKLLPVLAVALCVPSVVVRALHLLNGFDLDTGLPAVGDAWVWYFTAFLVVAAVVYAVLAAPLRARREESFEQLLGTQSPLFRMGAVISGLLLAAGGMGYLYLTMTTVGQDAVGWAKVLEMVYAVVTLLCGVCVIGLAKAQGEEMNEATAKLTLIPLIWSCLHLLVNYRMTCVDPKLASFAFGLVADVVLVLAFYHLARLLYGKPRPAWFAFFSAVTTTMAVSDMGGYGLSRLMGVTTPEWSGKMVLRGCLSVAACILLAAELFTLCRDHTGVDISE